jgi:hypothetical protein
MAVNNIQKIALADITVNIKTLIESYLQQGFVIMQIVNLNPTVNKLLIIYVTPEVIE